MRKKDTETRGRGDAENWLFSASPRPPASPRHFLDFPRPLRNIRLHQLRLHDRFIPEPHAQSLDQTIELHLPGVPLLVQQQDLLFRQLLEQRDRDAQPRETVVMDMTLLHAAGRRSAAPDLWRVTSI